MELDPRLRALVVGFVAEAQDLCARITQIVLDLEAGQLTDDACAQEQDDVARMLHTLKGSAAMLGLDDLADMAHALEDRFAPLRDEVGPLSTASADDLLAGLDSFMERLRERAGDPQATVHRTPRRPEGRQSVTQPAGDVASEPRNDRAEEPATWRVASNNVVALTREVERLRDLRLRLDDRRQAIASIASALGALATPATRLQVAALQSSLLDAGRALRLDAEIGGDIVDSLEDGVKTICTQPASAVIEPLRRLVRDVCRATGKEAALSVVGAEMHLDRRLLDRLGGALAHMIRNAVDHGIEDPEERIRRGKHREGALVIRIEHQGNLVLLEVSDDGGGIDVGRVREAAIERGLVAPDDLSGHDTRRLERLVFLPGLSTSREVSATSGRGVGMDAVRTTVESLGGQIEIETTPRQGTRFLITVPAEFGSSPILLVRSGGHELGMPMLIVERIVAVHASELRTNHGTKLVHGDEVRRLQDLGALLGLREPRVPAEGQPALVVSVQDERFAVLVDDVIGHLDLVVRPMPPELRQLGAYQGVATVASRQPMPILRAEWFARAEQAAVPTRRRALVVDDSLTARAMHRALLEAGGFSVHAVGDGATAISQLRQARYDVVVCDVAMEPVSGVELASRVRALPAIANVPIVLVSTHDAGADRERALASGADAFVSKQECASGKLLDAVEGCIARRRGAA